MQLQKLVDYMVSLSKNDKNRQLVCNYILNFIKEDPDTLREYLWTRYSELDEILAKNGVSGDFAATVSEYFDVAESFLFNCGQLPVQALVNKVRSETEATGFPVFGEEEKRAYEVAKKALRDFLVDYENLHVKES